MEDGDDFGDLYADVEVEASSAMNVAPQCSQSQCVSDETAKQDGDKDRASPGVDNDEDDDDDLDIVLNSDDDSFRHGEGFTIARNNTNLRSRELEEEDDDNLGTEEFMGGKAVGNSQSLYKYLRSQSAAYGSDFKGSGYVAAAYLSLEDNRYWQQMLSRSMGPQSAQRFSLPRARNILDVNIDIFEQKPWKHPGADITDYFNFGFNEDSWKLYCNQVDEYRHRGPMSGGTPPSEPAQSTEVDRRKGQAIQVEDSIFERQSSMDVRCQLDRDSDVIQITILDAFVPETTNHGAVSEDDVADHLSFSSASEDESVEGNYVEMDIYSPKIRSGSENHEIHQIATDETIRISNDRKESILVAELSEAEKSPANYSKSFEDDACIDRIDRRESYTHDRCLAELTRSVNPGYRHSEDSTKSNGKREPGEERYHGERRYHARGNNPVYNNRTRNDFNPKTHHKNDDIIISRRPNDKRRSGEHRDHARHSNGFFPMSDSTFRQRLHAFDPYNEENILYLKSEVPLDCYGERFCGYEDWDTERFGPNMDRPVFRSSEEEEYYNEQRTYIEDNRLMAGDWFHNERGKRKGENLYFRNKGEIDEFYFKPRYYDDMHGEKFRSFTHNYRKRDDENIRWKFGGPGRNKRRFCSPFSELNKTLLKKDDEPYFASECSEESHINNDRWHGNMMPKNSLYRKYFEPFGTEDYMIDIDGRVDMRRKRCHLQSEMQLEEDELMLRHENAKFYAYRKSFPFDDPHLVDSQFVDGYGYVEELTDCQLAKGFRYYKQKKEVFKCSKTYGKSHNRLSVSSRNSHLVVGKVKSSEKHKKPEWMDFDTFLNAKVSQAVKTNALDECLDIEEGQILTREVKVGPMKDKTRAHINDVNGFRNQNGKTGFDDSRILEAMAKMEKRRARFSEPITTTRKDLDSMIKLTVVDSFRESASEKQKRPTRKRRWGGS